MYLPKLIEKKLQSAAPYKNFMGGRWFRMLLMCLKNRTFITNLFGIILVLGTVKKLVL